MRIINIVDTGCDRYTIKSDCYFLGRQWDNLSEQMQIVIPEREKDHTCTMIVSADGVVIDHLDIKNEPKDITDVLSRHLNIEISFTFTDINGYVKNSQIKEFYFAEARKPEDFIPSEPEQSSKLDIVLGNAFIRAEVEDDVLRFYNANGDITQEISLPTGSGSGVEQESDPTVPGYVKSITEENIENWNNKATTEYVDNQVNDVRNVAEGKTKSFTVSNLSNLGTLLGIDTSVIADEYTITSTTIIYKEQNINLKQGDLFLIVDTSVPDYWVSVDDMKIYKMETTKIDLTNYVENTDYATANKAGVIKVNTTYGFKMNADGTMYFLNANAAETEAKATTNRPLTPKHVDYIVKYGLIDNKLEWTDEQKEKARVLLDAVSKTKFEETIGDIETLLSEV